MPAALAQVNSIWQIITHLGSASLLLPVMLVTASGLWQARQKAAVLIWLGSLVLAVAFCVATKVAYIGWGIGIESINFTGVSGHTLFATAVLPVLFHWLQTWQPTRYRYSGATLGLLVGLSVAASRVVLGAHSSSEVIAGWLLGMLVSGFAVRALERPTHFPRFFLAAPAILLFAFEPSASTYLPTHSYEIRLALYLSGHEKPFSRPLGAIR